MTAKNAKNVAAILNEQQEFDEMAFLAELNELNKILVEGDSTVNDLRMRSSELLAEVATLNEPTVDLTRFILLEMHDDFEVSALKVDDPVILSALEDVQIDEDFDSVKRLDGPVYEMYQSIIYEHKKMEGETDESKLVDCNSLMQE